MFRYSTRLTIIAHITGVTNTNVINVGLTIKRQVFYVTEMAGRHFSGTTGAWRAVRNVLESRDARPECVRVRRE